MNDSKRRDLQKLLGMDLVSRARDIEKIALELKDEPVARVRRLRSQAVIAIEDVATYSNLLQAEFPQLVYFFANFKTDRPTPSQFSDDVPITLYATLKAAVEAAVEVGHVRPAYNGLDFNRPNIIARWPWPDELAAGDPGSLIGGREFPDSVFDLAVQYRALGRWFMLRYDTRGYLHPRRSTSTVADWKLDKTKLPTETYWPFEIMGNERSEFFTLYDFNDAETTAFAKRTHALWRRIYTHKTGHYDPETGAAVTPDDWDGTWGWNIGKQALAGALTRTPRYAGFAPGTGPKGSRLMLGPLRK